MDFEGELALVIGRRARKLDADADWRDVMRGYTLANDVSARDLQKKDGQWTRAKGFDTFCPVGPLVSDEVDLDAGVTIETRVNGELRQHGSTRDFIFPIPQLLALHHRSHYAGAWRPDAHRNSCRASGRCSPAIASK